MEKEMEATFVYWGYIGIMSLGLRAFLFLNPKP